MVKRVGRKKRKDKSRNKQDVLNLRYKAINRNILQKERIRRIKRIKTEVEKRV